MILSQLNFYGQKAVCELSIIIPTYNAASYLEQTLDSIFSQNYQDFEILIIDDGSSDNTHQIIKKICDPRVRYFYQTNSGGPARPRNIGIRMSRGRYISIFDSDDIMLPGKLTETIDALKENPSAVLAHTNYQMISEDGDITRDDVLIDYHTLRALPVSSSKEKIHLINKADAYKGLIQSNFIATSSVILNKERLKFDDLFDETLKNADDKDMWLRLAFESDIIFIDKILHQYRLRSGSITFRGYEKRVDGILAVINKQLQRDLPPQLISILKKQEASHLYQAGYSCYEQEKKTVARHYFYRSFKADKNIKTLKMIVATSINTKLISLIKKLKLELTNRQTNRKETK